MNRRPEPDKTIDPDVKKLILTLSGLKQSILQKAFAGELTADVAYQQVVNG